MASLRDNHDGALELTVNIPVKAKLVVVAEYGNSRDATAEDLVAMGWHHQDDMYDRTRAMFSQAGVDLDESDAASRVRYFIEYITTYSHDMDAEDLGAFARVIEAGDAAIKDGA